MTEKLTRAVLREAVERLQAEADSHAHLTAGTGNRVQFFEDLRVTLSASRALLEAEPEHWYIQPKYNPGFCVTHKEDADAAEWHEKEHGHKVTPLYLSPLAPEGGEGDGK